MRAATLLLLINALAGFAFAQDSGSLAGRLFSDISDHKLDDFKPIEAAFILSDVRSEDSLRYYVAWYDGLVDKIKGFGFDAHEPVGSARKIFNYIRTTLYDEYRLEATTLLDIVERRRYNCVSSTILYNMVCSDMGWPTQAFETPTHVYSIFHDFDDQVIVENTHPMGFNIMQNLDVYSRYLAQFYPENQAYKIGLDQLYAHENRNGRTIDNTELLGLLAYNQAYFAAERGDYERAYELVLVAQDFNRDSRSNVNFEMNLYHKWGGQCFAQGRYYDAFEVLADGVYRHPENAALRRNLRAAFFNTLKKGWERKNWHLASQTIAEMVALEALNDRDRERLRSILFSWAEYLITEQESPKARLAIAQLKKLFGDSRRVRELERAVSELP